MANYNTDLKDWGASGSPYPSGYNYEAGKPPVDAYDNHLTYNLINDVQHLISLTNSRVESDSGSSSDEPSSPETSHIYHDQTNERLKLWHPSSSSWRGFLFRDGDSMTGALDMAGNNIQDSSGTLTLSGVVNAPDTLNYTGDEVATQNWVNSNTASDGHTHDSRYYTESEIDSNYDQSYAPIIKPDGTVPHQSSRVGVENYNGSEQSLSANSNNTIAYYTTDCSRLYRAQISVEVDIYNFDYVNEASGVYLKIFDGSGDKVAQKSVGNTGGETNLEVDVYDYQSQQFQIVVEPVNDGANYKLYSIGRYNNHTINSYIE